MNLLKLEKNLLTIHSKRLLYFAQIQSHLSYSLSIWGNMSSDTALCRLQKMQNKCVSKINNKIANKQNYKNLQILRIKQLLNLENCKFGYKLLHHELPTKIEELSKLDHQGKSLEKWHNYNTRKKQLPNKPLAKSKHYRNCVIYRGISDFELLKVETRTKPSLQSFVTACKAEMFNIV